MFGFCISPAFRYTLLQTRNALFSGKKPHLAEDGEGGTYFLKGVNDQ